MTGAEGALGLAGTAVLIADQWGELRYVSPDGGGHSFPRAEEVTDWVKLFLAIRDRRHDEAGKSCAIR